MSTLNIKRAVENIRSGTNVYTPIVETIVNAIQAIEEAAIENGHIKIIVLRSTQVELVDGKQSVESFTVTDNGIGFTKDNRDSFDTLYSDYKIDKGGKGFGRFTCLKYFENMFIESVFNSGDGYKQRSFQMGKETEIIIQERIENAPNSNIGSRVTLSKVYRNRFVDKKLKTIACELVERLLPYFIDPDYTCPKITIVEEDQSDSITLNNFVDNQLSGHIKEIALSDGSFKLGSGEDEHSFHVRIFKIYSPQNQKSKISLVADRREVAATAIHNYIPEFIDEFFDEGKPETDDPDRNYIVKAYVLGTYLDDNVSLERGGFEFPKGDDLLLSISQSEIELAVANIAHKALGKKIKVRQAKKQKIVQNYVETEAPWHRTIVEDIDLSSMPFNPKPKEIEAAFQKEKFKQEV